MRVNDPNRPAGQANPTNSPYSDVSANQPTPPYAASVAPDKDRAAAASAQPRDYRTGGTGVDPAESQYNRTDTGEGGSAEGGYYRVGNRLLLPGAMVWYRTHAHERQVNRAPDILPAVVTRVSPNETVNLTVFEDGVGNGFAYGAQKGWEDGEWCWPGEEPADTTATEQLRTYPKQLHKADGTLLNVNNQADEDKAVNAGWLRFPVVPFREFPKQLHKKAGETRVVNNQAEQDKATGESWTLAPAVVEPKSEVVNRDFPAGIQAGTVSNQVDPNVPRAVNVNRDYSAGTVIEDKR